MRLKVSGLRGQKEGGEKTRDTEFGSVCLCLYVTWLEGVVPTRTL